MNLEKLQEVIYEQVKMDDFKEYERVAKSNPRARIINCPGFVFEGHPIKLTLSQDFKTVRANQIFQFWFRLWFRL